MALYYGSTNLFYRQSFKIYANDDDMRLFFRVSNLAHDEAKFRFFSNWWWRTFTFYLTTFLVLMFVLLFSGLMFYIFGHKEKFSGWLDVVNPNILSTLVIVVITSAIIAVFVTRRDKRKFREKRIADMAWLRAVVASGETETLFLMILYRIRGFKNLRVIAEGLEARDIEELQSDLHQIYRFEELEAKELQIKELETRLKTLFVA